MSENGYVYVGRCPLQAIKLCSFESPPATSEAAAKEAVRAHIGGSHSSAHTHADLVKFCEAHIDPITRYVKEARP